MTIENILDQQRLFFKSQKTKSYHFRKNALKKLYQVIYKYQDDILYALENDLGKSKFEGYLTEIGVTLKEISYAMKHLKRWMRIKSVRTPLSLFKAKTYLYQEPYGNVLIMSPWNYPFQLSISPLVGAIAAGNTAVIKVSPESVHTSEIIKKMIEEIFEPEYISVILGDVEVSKKVLSMRYDYIFFTGSTRVGKIVMQEASKHLIPVTLELGGKSPTIIDETIDLKLAAKRIIFGKFVNAGQTCIAPDFILIKENLVDAFILHAEVSIKELYGDHPLISNDYPKIITSLHHQRLTSMLKDGNIKLGGKFDESKIEPTIMTDIKPYSLLKTEEIFGPILPIFTYKEENDVFDFLMNYEKPLALYVFSKNKKFIKKILNEVSFGGATLNDTIMHFANHHVPFGGVGYSGMGNYHGKHSFKTFSHEKAVLDRSTVVDLYFRYPPYSEERLNLIKKVIK